jgi:AraC family transcriptional activator of pobA
MNNKIKERCLKEGAAEHEGMSVITSEDIKDLLTFDEPFRSNSFVVIVMQNGNLDFNNNFVEINLLPNDVYFVTAGTLFELKEMSADVEFISIGFEKGYLKEQGVFLNATEIVPLLHSNFAQKFTLTDEEHEDLVNAMKLLRRKMHLPKTTNHLKEVIKHSFLSVLYELLIVNTRYSVHTPIKMNRQEELTASFLSLLGEQFKQEKKVQYYADKLFVGARHLSSVVRQVTGRTAGEIIDEMVVNEAKMLLSSHLMNVSQVADELCFSDQSFFGKFFKKHVGVSPSIFKTNTTVAIRAPF